MMTWWLLFPLIYNQLWQRMTFFSMNFIQNFQNLTKCYGIFQILELNFTVKTSLRLVLKGNSMNYTENETKTIITCYSSQKLKGLQKFKTTTPKIILKFYNENKNSTTGIAPAIFNVGNLFNKSLLLFLCSTHWLSLKKIIFQILKTWA